MNIKDIAAACYIGHVESQCVIELLNRNTVYEHDSPNTSVPKGTDEIASVLYNVNPLLTDESLYERLINRNEVSQFQTAIGSTYASKYDHAMPNDTCATDEISPDYNCADEDELLDKIFEESNEGTLDLDDIMVSAVHAGRHQGVNAKHLAKIWRIDEHTAKRTLDATSQRSVRTENPKLSRNFSTNDRTLRYKHLKEHFFMDTLFATSKAGKYSRKNTCAQLFVTDKGFVYVVPMQSEIQVYMQ